MRERVLKGAVTRTLVSLAAPVIAAEGIHTAFHLIDIFWVGPLGAWATGGIMTAMFSLWMAFALAHLVSAGIMAVVSQAVGSGRFDQAGHTVSQGVILAALLGIGAAAVGIPLAPALFRLLGTDEKLAAAGVGYLRIILAGSPVAFVEVALGAAMRASGNTRTPFKISASTLTANAILSPFFIFGLGPFPRLLVAGSAVATVICSLGGLAAYLHLLRRGHRDLPLHRPSLRRVDAGTMGKLIRIGVPYAAILILFSFVYLWYSHLAAAFGAAAVAIVGIANRLESITYMTADGFSSATATFVGQNIGANQVDRAETGAFRAASIMCVVGALLGACFLAFPTSLLWLFTREPKALALGAPYLRVLGICQLFTGLEIVLGGGFTGAGNTLPPMTIHVFFALLRIPLAWLAVFDWDLGMMGIAWTMTATCIVRSCILTWWFKRGHWKTHRLPAQQPTLLASENPEGPDICIG